jgi:hypothetical protein
VQVCQTSLEPKKKRKKQDAKPKEFYFLVFVLEKNKMSKDKTFPRLTTSYQKKGL